MRNENSLPPRGQAQLWRHQARMDGAVGSRGRWNKMSLRVPSNPNASVWGSSAQGKAPGPAPLAALGCSGSSPNKCKPKAVRGRKKWFEHPGWENQPWERLLPRAVRMWLHRCGQITTPTSPSATPLLLRDPFASHTAPVGSAPAFPTSGSSFPGPKSTAQLPRPSGAAGTAMFSMGRAQEEPSSEQSHQTRQGRQF